MLRRKGTSSADVTLTIASNPLYPGDAVDGEVTVIPHDSFVAALGVVRLLQTEVLRIDSARDAVPQIMAPGRRGGRRGLGPVFVDHVFAENVSMENGIEQRYPVRVHLPPQAMPTVKGKYARITWEISASVLTESDWMPSHSSVLANLTRGSAGECTQEIVVFARADGTIFGGERLPDEPRATRQHRKAGLDLVLATGQIANGGTLAGSLSVKPQRSFAARELRVELMRWERSGSKQARVVESSHVLQRPTAFTAGEETNWAFQLHVPDRLMPSVLGMHTFVGWQVRGVIARGILPNLTVSQPVQVYTSPTTVVSSLRGGSLAPPTAQTLDDGAL